MKKFTDSTIFEIINFLPEIYNQHSRDSKIYNFLFAFVNEVLENTKLNDKNLGSINLVDLGNIFFPFVQMGAINTKHLFALDELIIFAYYWRNRERYQKAADLGANLGLHSIIMARCGWNVDAYEPDPIHFKKMNENFILNELNQNQIHSHNLAVSDVDGESEFIRVLGNTTSSHLSGAKDNAYGELERFNVVTQSADKIFENIDFIKMDVEGSENKIILSTRREHWLNVDMMLEVGNEKSASEIYTHLNKLKINAFSQKNNWRRVDSLNQMPASYKEGSLFISAHSEMNW